MQGPLVHVHVLLGFSSYMGQSQRSKTFLHCSLALYFMRLRKPQAKFATQAILQSPCDLPLSDVEALRLVLAFAFAMTASFFPILLQSYEQEGGVVRV